MRTINFILLLVLAYGSGFGQKKELKQIKAHMANESSLIPYDITCEKFEKPFSEQKLRQRTITESVLLTKMEQALQP